MARRRRSPLKKALRAMAPHRVLWRVMSGPEVARAARSTFGTSTRTSAASRKKQIAKGKVVPTKRTAAKKTAKRADPYAAARAIPAQNRAAGAKMAQSAKKPAPMSERVLRGKGGKLAGSKPALSAEDQAVYLRAKNREVDPQLRIRNSRTRRG